MDIVRKVRDVKKADAELHRGWHVEYVARVLNYCRNFTPIFQTFIGVVVQNDVLENGRHSDRCFSGASSVFVLIPVSKLNRPASKP